MTPPLTTAQHATLLAIRDGTPHTLWPQMRRTLRHRGLIVAAGPRPAPTDHPRRGYKPQRYALTPAGVALLTELGDDARMPHRGPLKGEFRKAAP